MGKLFFSCAIVLLFVSCKQGKEKSLTGASLVDEISTVNWPKKATVNATAMAILNNWSEFLTLDSSFDALYNVENEEDLKLVIENLIEGQKLVESSTYPEKFDVPQIKSRQKVFKTYVLKTKGNLEYQQDIQEPVSEMITAYNAYRNQFNVIVNNTLDTKLILED